MTDVNQLITEHLDIWTSAIEKKSSAGRGNGGAVTLYGIKRLRALVLELAVRGKLVPQVVDDGATNSYLDDVIRVRNELVKHGKAKKLKKLPAILESEVPFEIPNGWSWVRLQEISGYIQRGKSPKYADSGRVQVISQKCVQWGTFDLEKARYISDDSIEGYGPERFLRSGDVLWNSTGTGTVGRVLSVEIEEEQAFVADSHVTVVRSISGCPKFLEVYLSSAGIQDRIDPTHERSLVSGSTKQVELNTSTVNALPIPLPSLEEQHRIVAKVDELMALCDALERQAEDSLRAHQTLVETCLATLTNSQTPEELTQNWTRIEAHFDTLFTTEESVAALEASIFELAIKGVLVRQDRADEAADVFLRRLGIDSDASATLPEGWAKCSLGGLGKITGGGTPKKSTASFWNGNIPWVSPKDMKVDYISDAIDKITEAAVAGSSVKIIEPFSLLFVVRGMILAHSFPVAITETEVTINQDMKAVDLSEFDRAYVLLMMKGLKREILSRVERSSHGTCKLVSDKLWSVELPIPPREEQKRIADKVKDLVKMCADLRRNIRTDTEKKFELAETLTSKIH